MFFKVLNFYQTLTFNKKDYSKIIEQIIKSRAYLSYIDTRKNSGYPNKRYLKYLEIKESTYNVYVPDVDDTIKNNAFIPFNTEQEYSVKDFKDRVGIADDYDLTLNIDVSSTGISISPQIRTIESLLAERALNLDSEFENTNRRYLSKEFILDKHKRFTLPPFLSKYNDKYLEPIIIANVYEVGILNLQIIIPFEYESIPASLDSHPTDIVFEDVHYYKLHKEFKTKDYYEKDFYSTQTIYNIAERYIKHLQQVCTQIEIENKNFSRSTWMLCDLNENKNPNHSNFIEKNKDFYVAHILNGDGSYVKSLSKNFKDDLLNQAGQMRKNTHFMFSKTGSLLSVGYMDFKEAVDEIIEENKNEIDSDEDIKVAKNDLYKYFSFQTLVQMFRFYELSYIKYFYYRSLLQSLKNQDVSTLEGYNSIISEFNELQINYHSTIIFMDEGSPKDLYEQSLELTGVNELQKSIEVLIAKVREDVEKKRTLRIQATETYVLIVSSILAVILSYRGFDIIVEEVLLNLLSLDDNSAFYIKVVLWLLFFILIIVLNCKRLFLIKNK
ncbi:hypothetical protein [Alkalihalobacterium bogoriense]|uniref:hypothetical protein n=1 Tax=Alkalihalobacterium bogoriense TaxID=246272 RepID=UPI00047D05B8|nr:hypothetical protein [Alkalihalobacterium bogoriense]